MSRGTSRTRTIAGEKDIEARLGRFHSLYVQGGTVARRQGLGDPSRLCEISRRRGVKHDAKIQ